MDRNRKYVFMLMRALNRINGAYDEFVKQYDVKEPELWLTYALAEGKPLSQKQMCDEWGIPRTTINAIVKKWENEGLVILSPVPGKRREMTIRLTEQGEKRADNFLSKLFRIERRAMRATLKQYPAEFIEAVQFFEENLAKYFEEELAQKGVEDKKSQN